MSIRGSDVRRVGEDDATGCSIQPVTIVSGFPRSGTSLVMRMLEAGGMPVLIDNVRPPDKHNPAGYHEFAPVKRTARDASWLAHAGGRAVKVVSMLLPSLPTDRCYRVIFMRRNLDALLASQATMLSVRPSKPAACRPSLRTLVARHVDESATWIAGQAHMRVFICDYERLIQSPVGMATRLVKFIGGTLDIQRMAAVVDPSLVHHGTSGRRCQRRRTR